MATGPDRHGRFHLLTFDLSIIQTRLCAQDIRCHIKPPLRPQKQAEIPGVAIGRPDQPKQDLYLTPCLTKYPQKRKCCSECAPKEQGGRTHGQQGESKKEHKIRRNRQKPRVF